MNLDKPLQLIALNELNFDFVKKYVDKYPEQLIGFDKLFKSGVLSTCSESCSRSLEPWIQWPSIYTGLQYSDHGLFRLGDAVSSEHQQFWEIIEDLGYRVGAVAPMNARNRTTNAEYFLPDPWTLTDADSGFWTQKLARALRQTVNDNSAGYISLSSYFNLVICAFFAIPVTQYMPFFSLVVGSRKRKWLKPLVLDFLLFYFHKKMFKRKSADFSTLFLNAGAHLQHHYLFNANEIEFTARKNPEWYVPRCEDPFFDMLKVYDTFIEDVLEDSASNYIFATGLTQVPEDRPTFYYRLRNHSDFLTELGIQFTAVHPRMTRDFLIEFSDVNECLEAERRLSTLFVVQSKDDAFTTRLFDVIDNRGASLFVTLTYPYEITTSSRLVMSDGKKEIINSLVFVAVKNGGHDGRGFIASSPSVLTERGGEARCITTIFEDVVAYFESDLSFVSKDS